MNLYVPEIYDVKIKLESKDINSNYKTNIVNIVKSKYGNKCYKNGYINKETIELLSIGSGIFKGSHISGFITFNVIFKAQTCIPRKNEMINCRIRDINNFGIIARLYPINIFIPRKLQLKINKDILINLAINDYIKIKIHDYNTDINQIFVIGEIVEKIETEIRTMNIPKNNLLSSNFNISILIDNVPPSIESLLGDNEPLNKLKSRITKHEKIWNYVKLMLNDYELIDKYRTPSKAIKHYYNPIVSYTNKTSSIYIKNFKKIYPVFSRAYFKLWEILFDNKIFDKFKNIPINIGCLAEGPGGFIHSIIDYRNMQHNDLWTKDKIFAITLKKPKTKSNIQDWSNKSAKLYFAKARKKNYKIITSYGKTGDGNLLNVENIKYFYQTDMKNIKCDLVTADGGISLETDEAYNLQEILNFKLFFSEIVSALTIQNIGGCFILKIYDIYYSITEQLLRLLSIYYESVIITKPYTSRNANSEKYIICNSFVGINENKLHKLYRILEELIKTDKYIYNIFSMIENPESDFINVLNDYNSFILKIQIRTINEGISLINTKKYLNKKIKNDIYDFQKKTCIIWCKKYKIPYNV